MIDDKPKFLTDEENSLSSYIQCVDTTDLLDAANNPNALITLIRRKLSNRGVNKNGTWIGFDLAAKLWKEN